MGSIGKKVGSQQNSLNNDIKTAAKQVVQGVPIIGEYDISNILANLKI